MKENVRMARKPEYTLQQQYIDRKQAITLGGYRQGEPNRVRLSHLSPNVSGEEYGIYCPEFLRLTRKGESINAKSVLSKMRAAKAAEPETAEPETAEPKAAEPKAAEPLSSSADVRERLSKKPIPKRAPRTPVGPDLLAPVGEMALEGSSPVEEPDAIEAEDSKPTDEPIKLPSLSEIATMNREPLIECINRLGLRGLVSGTGEDGYERVGDFRNVLIEYVNEQNQKG
jgi:hypothetical protein